MYVVIVGTIINFGLMWSFDMRFITQLFLGALVAFFLGASTQRHWPRSER